MAIEQVLSDIAPQFDSIDTGRRDRLIGYAENQVDITVFEDDYELAVAYLVAHMLTLYERMGNSGALTNRREGDLQIGYTVPTAPKNENFSQTSYGLEFMRLRSMHILPVRVANAE